MKSFNFFKDIVISCKIVYNHTIVQYVKRQLFDAIFVLKLNITSALAYTGWPRYVRYAICPYQVFVIGYLTVLFPSKKSLLFNYSNANACQSFNNLSGV